MRTCRNCGTTLPEEYGFCIQCGTPVSEVEPDWQQADQGLPKTSRTSIAIAILIAALFVGAAIVLAAVRPWEHAAGDSSSSSSATQIASLSDSSAESSGADSIVEPSSDGEASGQTFDPNASIDLNDAGQLQAMNLFLSNFSEKGSLMNGYTFEGSDDAVVADFSACHVYLNNPEAVHEGMGPGIEEVDTETFLLYSELFLKRDLASVLSNGAGPYSNLEARVRLYPDRVPTSPLGVVYATSSKDVGKGRTEVAFDIYYGGPYEVLDESLYRSSLDDLKAALGVDAPIASGTAVVEPFEDGSIAPYKLWSYDSTRQ